MKPTGYNCPKCGHRLFISNGGDYWCTSCQQWQDARNVDPHNRDVFRFAILTQAETERAHHER